MAIVAYRAPIKLSCASPIVPARSPSLRSPDRHQFLRFRAEEDLRSLSASSNGNRWISTGEGSRKPKGRPSCARSGTSSLVTAVTWKGSVLSSELPVLVEFFAAWCGPCRMVNRLVDEIAEEYAGRIVVFKVNADHCPQLTMEYDVESVPTVLVFKDGQRLESIIGTMPKTVYIGAIEKTLA